MRYQKFFAFVALMGLAAPLLASAHAIQLPFWGPIVSCTGSVGTDPNFVGPPPEGTSSLPPCESLCDLLDTFQHIIYFGMSLLLFAIAPVLVLWGGVMILISAGSPDRLGTGKKIITGAIIGVAIVLGAFLIINTFLSVINVVSGGQGPILPWSSISCSVK